MEIDQDPDMVLADLSDGGGEWSDVSEASLSSDDIEDGLQDGLETESEVVLRTSQQKSEDKQAKIKRQATKR